MESIRGTYKYEHAICITEELLKEIDALYRDYFDVPEYIVNFGAHTITLNKLEDVFAIDNFGDEKIKSMIIGLIFENYIMLEADNTHYSKDASSTVEVTYRIDSLDNATTYRRKLEKIFNKSKRSKPYDYFSHLTIGTVSLFITFVSFLYSFYTMLFSNVRLDYKIPLLVFVLIVVCTLAGLRLLTFLFMKVKMLFPPIVFCWGEEIKAEEKRQNIRTGVFWSVIIASIIGILSGIIVNIIS